MQRTSLFLTVIWLVSAPASAQVFESVGTRALGMGGAFVAVADDATATYWNPAGLATGALLDVALGYDRAGHGSGGDAAGPPGGESGGPAFAFAIPAIGFSYNRLRVTSAACWGSSTAAGPASRQDLRPDEAGVSSLVTGQLGVTLVQSVVSGVAIGTTLKLVRGTLATGSVPAGTSLEEALELAEGMEGRGSTAFDLDVGIMVAAGQVRAGLVARNVVEPRFESPSGEETTLHRQVRAGVVLMPVKDDDHGLLFSLDADLTRTPTAWGDRRQVALGAERWWASRRLGLRAGARASTVGAARPVATVGISVGVTKGVYAEAAGTRGHSGGDRGWTVGIRAGY